MNQQHELICGVDEVGRGPLAGPVVTAAVILDPEHPVEGLADSKKLSEKKRTRLAAQIREKSLCWTIARAEVHEIDEINILHATMLAMRRAVEQLTISPVMVLIDGNRVPPGLAITAQAIVGGDALHDCISAASIIAKVARDAEMCQMEQQYPGYGFDKHKGYPTKAHIQALEMHGVTQIHRRSFAPVRRIIQQSEQY